MNEAEIAYQKARDITGTSEAQASIIWNEAIKIAYINAKAYIREDNHGNDIPIVSSGSILKLQIKLLI